MISKEMILTLFEYNYWANERILECTARVSESSFVESVDYGRGGLRELLFHMFLTEWIWRTLCQEHKIQRSLMPRQQDVLSLDQLRIRWSQDEQLMKAFIGGLSEEELAEMVEFKNWRGESMNMTILHMLVHVVLHSMQHRSEAATLLTKYDQSPGDLDFIFFVQE